MSSFSRLHDEAADAHATSPVAPASSAPGGGGGGADPAVARAIDLLKRSQRGDRSAYGQLVVLYQDRVFNAILRMVGDRDEAAELTQEAFTRGLSNLDSFRGDAAPYTWLFRIAVNLAISRLRRVQRHRVFSLDAAGSNGRSAADRGGNSSGDQAAALIDRVRQQDASNQPSHALEQRERAEQVVAALGRIDAEYRAVLVMRDVEGFDYQQMADVLGLPLGTLKSRLFRARIALRDELKAYMS
ncbi:MAG TPA: sigma-70 family RNA polymerase sigma factor [Tepidisphaeraceae bacterium]|nr:sigma-70 family RNA polymerase sigma factor [Tepidisphaeraceae bacterium]